VKLECREVRERLSTWLDLELPPETHDLIAAHLEGCSGCRRALAQLRAVEGALDELEVAPPARLADKVLARLQERQVRAARRHGWQSLALAASLVLGILLGGGMARNFYPQTPVNGTAETASLQDFHDFPQGSLGTILASYQPDEGSGS
jgi:predicted anti-sigma-YlaC factor YlaD